MGEFQQFLLAEPSRIYKLYGVKRLFLYAGVRCGAPGFTVVSAVL